MKRALLFFSAALLILLLLVGAVSVRGSDSSFNEAHTLIVMRKVGHEVLRYTGDSSTPQLPVAQLSSDTYLLSFKKGFPFKPDSLVAVIDRVLSAARPGADYIVNVLERRSNNVVFGYAMQPAGQEQLVPCLGREQATGAYDIRIRFRGEPLVSKGLLIGSGVALLGACLLGVAFRQRGPKAAALNPGPPVAEGTETASQPGIGIGQFLFLTEQQCLLFGNERIALTGKEAQLLAIFANSPNVVIDRQRLQKIWDDEGVIVGRSLDVFISRLRKKLEKDPALSLVNIHGKGYKLEVGVPERT